RARLFRARGVPGVSGQRPLAGDTADRRTPVPAPADRAPVLPRPQARAAPRPRAALWRPRRPPRILGHGRARHPYLPALRAKRVHRDTELFDPATPRSD